MRKGFLAALASLVVMACAGPATAEAGYFMPPCGGFRTCDYDPSGDGMYYMDYSLPTDGSTQQWDFWINNDDPNASLFLQYPDEPWAISYYSDGTQGYASVPSFEWNQITTPGHLSLIVRGPTSWNNCSDPNATGLCGISFMVWGNGTFLTVHSSAPGVISFSERTIAVPEPAIWAMMLLGFLAIGTQLRRRSLEIVPN